MLLSEFRREALRLSPGAPPLPAGDALELLARHHGLPSPLLDWSGSPYTAAFFAFEVPLMGTVGEIAVWTLGRAKLPSQESGIDLIDNHDLLRFNMRALQQRGFFLRVSTMQKSVEALLSEALTKISTACRRTYYRTGGLG